MSKEQKDKIRDNLELTALVAIFCLSVLGVSPAI